jgi:hypothetical protein
MYLKNERLPNKRYGQSFEKAEAKGSNAKKKIIKIEFNRRIRF